MCTGCAGGMGLNGLGCSRMQAQGLGADASLSPLTGGLIPVAINAGAGYLVGNLLGMPVAGAVASGAFGIVGLLGVAIYAAHKAK